MILTFGEIMLRLSTPEHRRYSQCMPGYLDASFGGGEANVAVSLAHFGEKVAYMTALPDNVLSHCLVAELQRYGVDTSRLRFSNEGRLGIYFVETGSNQRPSVVQYDRAHSAIALAEPAFYDFDSALKGVRWVHTTGITPAISRNACEATLMLVSKCSAMGIPVSVDLNFRKKLWRWDDTREPKTLARECMNKILEHVTLVIANEEDSADVLDIHAKGTSVDEGRIAADAYVDVAREICSRFPKIERVAITLRESISADHNNWGGLLYVRELDEAFFGPINAEGEYSPYIITDIVDRVGGGDSFGAGLIHALHTDKLSAPQDAIRFAAAASALKHTIRGDFNLSTEKEVEALMKGSGSGRVQR